MIDPGVPAVVARDDVAAVRIRSVPPWLCCHRRGLHHPSCPWASQEYADDEEARTALDLWEHVT